MRACHTRKSPHKPDWRAARSAPRWLARAADWSKPMTRDRKEDSMSHVDEGTLHAYLDGELSPAERTDLEQHLAQCAECRAQLAEERALLERSTALLAATRPAERPAPPFEQVRRAPKRPWYLRTPVAWAASIVLAIGVGYYLRDTSNEFKAPTPQPVGSVRDFTTRDSNAATP